MAESETSSRRILVSPRSLTKGRHPALTPLTEHGYDIVRTPEGRLPTQEELLNLLPGCVGWIAGVEEISGDLLRSADGLRVISRNGAGTENIDHNTAAQLGITVLRAAGANARSVAELTWGLALSLARSLPASDAAIKNGGWQRLPGIELHKRRLGVIGCGSVGKIVAGYGVAFGMQVTAFDPYPDHDAAESTGFTFAPPDAVISTSDVLCLHCPPGPEPIIGAEQLRLMPHGALLVNTARAELVDENAVAAALDSGRLAGYAADVFSTEPPQADDPLARHPRVIASPHTGAFTEDAVNRAAETAVRQLLDFLDGVRF